MGLVWNNVRASFLLNSATFKTYEPYCVVALEVRKMILDKYSLNLSVQIMCTLVKPKFFTHG